MFKQQNLENIGVRGGGQLPPPPPIWTETLISRAISTQESGKLPYHVKTICSYLQKSTKKRNNFILKTREMAFARLYISKFSRRRMPLDPSTTLAA